VSLICGFRMEREKASVDTDGQSKWVKVAPWSREGACRGSNRR
jgi:hypothetical protein